MSWAVPSDAEKSSLPGYVPITVSVPTGAFEATQLARPELKGPLVVHRMVPPTEKVTVPDGFPPSE